MFKKLKGRRVAAKEKVVSVAKNYLIENKDQIKEKIGKNEEIKKLVSNLIENKDQIKEKIGKNEGVKKLVSNKKYVLTPAAKIAGYLYGFLPPPVKLVIKKNDFVEFTIENIDFILEAIA